MARQIDLVIGGELGHFERGRHHGLPEPVGSFITEVTAGDSRVAWWRARQRLGESRALALAAEAFNGPGVEYGGDAWGPVAAILRRYVDLELSPAIFVGQCFTLEHNNGSLFDKYFATDDLRAVLDSQAAGDLAALAARAPEEVRRRWRAHHDGVHARYDAVWLGLPTGSPAFARDGTYVVTPAGADHAVAAAPVGALGCGDNADAVRYDDEQHTRPVRIGPSRRRPPRRPLSREITGAAAVLQTDAGPIHVELWPAHTPHTVDAFVGLADGTLAWTDPVTRRPGSGGFYDGTPLHRRIPGFVVQGGDRTGTGEHGPGFRIPDETDPNATFDRPYLMAMTNTGPNSAGSQFFITLAAAVHLDGRYCQFGEVTDPESQWLLHTIAAAPDTVRLRRVEVTTW
jgi:cyclophilin family peptidyl-prolyl cis-trans isomerase